MCIGLCGFRFLIIAISSKPAEVMTTQLERKQRRGGRIPPENSANLLHFFHVFVVAKIWYGVNTYRYITIVGWTSILTQLWLGVNKRYQGFDTLPCGWKVKNMCKWMIRFLEKYIWNCSWILHDVTTQHVDFEHQDLDFTCYLKQWKVGCSITYRTITSLEMPGCKWIDTWRILRYHPPFCVGKVWQKNGLITLELEKYG